MSENKEKDAKIVTKAGMLGEADAAEKSDEEEKDPGAPATPKISKEKAEGDHGERPVH